VEDVLREAPREDTPHEGAGDAEGGDLAVQHAHSEEERGDRDPRDEDRDRMDAREALEKVALEHPARVFRADAPVHGAVALHLLRVEDLVRHGGKALGVVRPVEGAPQARTRAGLRQ
jgi:hypothetical protein